MTRSARTGWSFAALVYLLAVLHRSSLSVAGLLAEQRFGISPAELSVFIFLQLGIYAAMQVPTGVLVDRYGPRRMLVAASLLMGTAQLLFASVQSYPAALAARALLGGGDAMTFISVLRFTSVNFSPRRYPLLVAITGMIGTVGNLIATLPLALALRGWGWGYGFGIAGVLSIGAAVSALVFVDDSTLPPSRVRSFAQMRAGVRAVWQRVLGSWSLPGTRLGFWVHFACMSSAGAFGVLWGSPYLIKVSHYSTAGAGAVLMASVLAAAGASPAIGSLIGRRPIVRVPLALGVCCLTLVGWIVLVTAFGYAPPRWYVVALFALTAIGGPASMIAFALARDYNHSRTLGTASGVVNVGGFTATVLIALGIGWALDAQGGTSVHALRWAVLVAVGVQLLGTIRMAVWLRRLRAFNLGRQLRGEDVPVAVVRRRWDLPEPPL
jgi:MFS family permease